MERLIIPQTPKKPLKIKYGNKIKLMILEDWEFKYDELSILDILKKCKKNGIDAKNLSKDNIFLKPHYPPYSSKEEWFILIYTKETFENENYKKEEEIYLEQMEIYKKDLIQYKKDVLKLKKDEIKKLEKELEEIKEK